MEDLLEEAGMAPYDPILDYAGCVIQYGYVVYFSVSWPLAPLVCALHTMFRLRSNTLRLTKLSMRPLPEAASNIGLWQKLLLFEAWSGVLINCLLVSVSTDQLDYVTCWTHSLFREQGTCESGHVPMTARFLIAVAAEHLVLAIIVLINALVPEREEAFNVRLKRAAFQFKKRYMAERLMNEADATDAVHRASTAAGGGLRQRNHAATSPSAIFRAPDVVDFEADWRSGSELSDAYETDADETDGPGTRATTTRRV